METVIVICLFTIIFLLLQDKIVIMTNSKNKQNPKRVNPDLPEIIGQPKPIERHSTPNTANESQNGEQITNPDNLDIEYDENEDVNIQIPQEELDQVFSDMPDFEEEEEEWGKYGITGDNNSLARGVTFDELSAVGMLLQQDELEPSQKKEAIAIVQKIQGTELFSLLESSVGGASQKIAALLDDKLSTVTETSPSNVRKNDFSDFDIGEFV